MIKNSEFLNKVIKILLHLNSKIFSRTRKFFDLLMHNVKNVGNSNQVQNSVA